MEEIYSLIQENPAYFAWAFGIINVLWIGFTYFNRQSHEKAMVNLTNKLRLDSDRRRKLFELKASQYEAYVSNLDVFGKKHQVDLPVRMQPIFNKYFTDYLTASQVGDKEREAEVISWFGAQIAALIYEVSEDYFKIQAESNKLKLTATDEMIKEFDNLESLIKQAMDESTEFMSGFTQMVLSNNFEVAIQFQKIAIDRGEQIKASSKILLNLMRAELTEI
ncbi:MAG: hypothetical protein ABFD82_15615 [Syntrophaceae bacterium]